MSTIKPADIRHEIKKIHESLQHLDELLLDDPDTVRPPLRSAVHFLRWFVGQMAIFILQSGNASPDMEEFAKARLAELGSKVPQRREAKRKPKG